MMQIMFTIDVKNIFMMQKTTLAQCKFLKCTTLHDTIVIKPKACIAKKTMQMSLFDAKYDAPIMYIFM